MSSARRTICWWRHRSCSGAVQHRGAPAGGRGRHRPKPADDFRQGPAVGLRLRRGLRRPGPLSRGIPHPAEPAGDRSARDFFAAHHSGQPADPGVDRPQSGEARPHRGRRVHRHGNDREPGPARARGHGGRNAIPDHAAAGPGNGHARPDAARIGGSAPAVERDRHRFCRRGGGCAQGAARVGRGGGGGPGAAVHRRAARNRAGARGRARGGRTRRHPCGRPHADERPHIWAVGDAVEVRDCGHRIGTRSCRWPGRPTARAGSPPT